MKCAAMALVVWGFCCVLGGKPAATQETEWPGRDWSFDSPNAAGLDEATLKALDADLKNGKYPLVDSFAVFRCGKQVYAREYVRDYREVYGRQAKERGPLNARLTGPYNYFDHNWHPYYHGTRLHTMQSVSKTASSVILGIAIGRGEFKAGLDTPVLKYFDQSKVKNLDDRKRRMKLRDVLTMTAGLEWMEDVPYDDPRSDSSRMEATDDWVQYVIDKPMAAEPGSTFNYSSGVSELLAHIFLQEVGQDIDSYGEKYLFQPLGMDHFWKKTYLGVVDTEGGLYLRDVDLAKIGYLYLHSGNWKGTQLVSPDWVKQSLAASTPAEEDYRYGFQWWLLPQQGSGELVWMARGFGGQNLMVFPREELIATITGWDILGEKDPAHDYVARILSSVRRKGCAVTGQ